MVVFHNAKGGAEDAGFYDLELGVGGDGAFSCFFCSSFDFGLGWGIGFVDLLEGLRELAAEAHPFRGFEVGVLEEDHHGCGAKEGGVLAVELGFAEFWRSVRWRLGRRISGYRWMGGCHLLNRGCWGNGLDGGVSAGR